MHLLGGLREVQARQQLVHRVDRLSCLFVMIYDEHDDRHHYDSEPARRMMNVSTKRKGKKKERHAYLPA